MIALVTTMMACNFSDPPVEEGSAGARNVRKELANEPRSDEVLQRVQSTTDELIPLLTAALGPPKPNGYPTPNYVFKTNCQHPYGSLKGLSSVRTPNSDFELPFQTDNAALTSLGHKAKEVIEKRGFNNVNNYEITDGGAESRTETLLEGEAPGRISVRIDIRRFAPISSTVTLNWGIHCYLD